MSFHLRTQKKNLREMRNFIFKTNREETSLNFSEAEEILRGWIVVQNADMTVAFEWCGNLFIYLFFSWPLSVKINLKFVFLLRTFSKQKQNDTKWYSRPNETLNWTKASAFNRTGLDAQWSFRCNATIWEIIICFALLWLK